MLAETLVDAVVYDGGRATAVRSSAGEIGAGEIVLAASAYGSPAILLRSGIGPDTGLSVGELFRLLDECRRQKEAVHPNTRKIVVDLDHVREGWGKVTVAAGNGAKAHEPLRRWDAHLKVLSWEPGMDLSDLVRVSRSEALFLGSRVAEVDSKKPALEVPVFHPVVGLDDARLREIAVRIRSA